MRAGSADDTAASEGRRCLVLAPHPDDETIGTGATVARKRAAGTDVRVLVVTDGRHSHRSAVITPDHLARIRSAEFVEACGLLGVPAEERVQLGLEEGTLGEPATMSELVAVLRRHIEDFAPDEVLVTSALDWHEDHQMVNLAVRSAVAGDSAPLVREYPVWAWADGPWSNQAGRGAARSAVDLLLQPWLSWRAADATHVLAGPHLATKQAALRAYRSQLTSLSGEPEWAVFDERFLALFLVDRETFLSPTWRSS